MAAYVPLTDEELQKMTAAAPFVEPQEPFDRLIADDRWLRSNMLAVLRLMGETGTCRGCDAPIVWLKSRDGRALPYTPLGLNHFADCPAREKFRNR